MKKDQHAMCVVFKILVGNLSGDVSIIVSNNNVYYYLLIIKNIINTGGWWYFLRGPVYFIKSKLHPECNKKA